MGLTLTVCQKAETKGIPVGFFGGSPDVLQTAIQNLKKRFPLLKISWVKAPPFRSLTPTEEKCYRSEIIKSGIRILFIGLGCPKQESWMGNNKGKIPVVMVGVGAVFNFLAGKVKRAPLWAQRLGLEWFYRFLREPFRLWRRYFWHNPHFIWLVIKQLFTTNGFWEDKK